MLRLTIWRVLVTLLVGCSLWTSTWAQGVALNGVGPVNRSMGGAATAAPLDSAGALYWNPATIVALPASDCSVAMETVLPRSEVRSRMAANAMGPGLPPLDMEGTTKSDSGVAPVPVIAFVHKPPEQTWAYGLGLFGIGGFNGNYASSETNPIFTPSPPVGLGVGRVAAQLDILQLVPTAAWVISDHVSIGLAPTVTLARLTASPAFFAAPDDANGDGFASYPDATGTPYHWGAGFQAGIYYTGDAGWHFGASLKSPQWFETFEFSSADELGRPRTFAGDFDYPLIASVGTAYSGILDTVFACDLRYFSYGDADGFGVFIPCILPKPLQREEFLRSPWRPDVPGVAPGTLPGLAPSPRRRDHAC